jgi:molybdopterin converting factor small subunit
MARLLLFGPARSAAGVREIAMSADSVAEVLDQAKAQFGDEFARVLSGARVWVNGDASDRDALVCEDDEIAVLPPVSGG